MYDVPVFISEKQTDCGAASLKMLLGYYETDVDIDVLREECGTRLIGCSMADLKRVGALHGLSPVVFNMGVDELLVQDRPAIILWKYNHFVVFCGLNDDGDPIINNPTTGRYHIPVNSFKVMYSGIAYFNGRPEPEL